MDLYNGAIDVLLEYKITVVIILLLCFLYYHYTSPFSFFEKRGIYYKTPTILVGNIGERIRMKTSFHEFQLKLYKDFDGLPYAGLFEGRRPIIMLRDPDLIKAVLIRDFDHFMDRNSLSTNEPNYFKRSLLNLKGAEWKSVRSILTPSFSSARLRGMTPYINECVSQMVDSLKANAKENPEVEMKKFMGRFTLDTIGTCAFGIECSSLKNENAHFVKVAEKFDSMSKLKRFFIFFVLIFMPQAFKYLNISFLNGDAARELVQILSYTKTRRSKDVESRRNDFLQLLIDALDKEEEENTKKPTQKRYLDNDTIDAQALLFLIAGFETSSTLLSFVSHTLAMEPEVQTKLRKDVKEIVSHHNGEINYESIADMHYLEAVLSETLRLYPAVSRVDRVCTKKYTLPGTNVTIRPGETVLAPIIGIHMDPQHYPEPEKFRPERFLGEEKANRPSHLYLPFGAGPRNCIGLRFAMTQAKLAMARLVLEFEMSPCSKTKVPVALSKGGILLKAEHGLWIKVTPVSG